jgi:hypothetical protein
MPKIKNMNNKTTDLVKKILISIVTTKDDWREKIKTIDRFGLQEIALFPTCLNKDERKEIYGLLKETKVRSIPLVHIREDMTPAELDYLIENYDVRVFCSHGEAEHPLIYDYSKYKKMIAIENVYHPLSRGELKKWGGICLDVSHLENDRLLNQKRFKENIKALKKFPILGNHISAVRKTARLNEDGEPRYDRHRLENFSELDYLKRYPLNYFSAFCAIELENSIKEQLTIKNYIEKMLLAKE